MAFFWPLQGPSQKCQFWPFFRGFPAVWRVRPPALDFGVFGTRSGPLPAGSEIRENGGLSGRPRQDRAGRLRTAPRPAPKIRVLAGPAGNGPPEGGGCLEGRLVTWGSGLCGEAPDSAVPRFPGFGRVPRNFGPPEGGSDDPRAPVRPAGRRARNLPPEDHARRAGTTREMGATSSLINHRVAWSRLESRCDQIADHKRLPKKASRVVLAASCTGLQVSRPAVDYAHTLLDLSLSITTSSITYLRACSSKC